MLKYKIVIALRTGENLSIQGTDDSLAHSTVMREVQAFQESSNVLYVRVFAGAHGQEVLLHDTGTQR